MKNKLYFISFLILLSAATSCKKDLIGSPITLTGSTNDTIHNFYYHITNKSFDYCPPIASPAIGSPKGITYTGNGNYQINLDEEESNRVCISITGTIPANEDTVGVTKANIQAFFTEHSNIVGFKNVELKRPHEEYKIEYQFRPDTYIE